jgi:hypothetical protein
MPIRVQPAEIEIPENDPFANDLLGRKESIEALTTLLRNIEGPCVIAVDASWGMGKTTFLRMWAQHLRGERHPVVEFNAWETDFTWDPFFALWSEISAQFAQESTLGRGGSLSDIARNLLPFLRGGATSASLAFAAGGEPEAAMTAAGVSATLKEFEDSGDASDQGQDAGDETPFLEATYVEAKSLLSEFRTALQEQASALAAEHNGLPLVVLIDELDRCRPTYAIELLETAKHLFSADRIVFVLCLDRVQLTHSVRAVYGSHFNADGYLRRFFDIDYRLPLPGRSTLLFALGKDLQIAEQLEHLASRGQLHSRIGNPTSLHFIVNVLDASPLSLRDLQQALNRLSLLLASVHELHVLHLESLVILLVLRTLDSELYRRALAGIATDDEAVAAFALQKSDPRDSLTTVRATVEAVLSACVCLSSADASGRPNEEMVPLLLRNRQIADVAMSDHTAQGGERTMAMLVVDYTSRFCGRHDLNEEWDFIHVTDQLGFRTAVRCLELFPD